MRGVDGEMIFRSAEDRAGYLLMLGATVRRYRWHCLAYCLMGTHLHLLVETPDANFGDGMRWLHGHYGSGFNRQHQRRGHLFQGRYHDEPVLTESHYMNAVRYITANPVDAGLCRHPDDWPWSSHAVMRKLRRHPWLSHARLVDHFDALLGPRSYERLVATIASRY